MEEIGTEAAKEEVGFRLLTALKSGLWFSRVCLLDLGSKTKEQKGKVGLVTWEDL